MYCPNCGTKTSKTQRFCRTCGLGLDKIVESLAEQLPTKTDISLLQQKERLERLGIGALGVFGVSILAFFLYNVFYKLMLTQGRVFAGLAVLGLMVVVACGLLSVILFAKANELKELAKHPSHQAPELSETVPTGKLLEEGRETVFSVADRTTDLLSAPRVPKKDE